MQMDLQKYYVLVEVDMCVVDMKFNGHGCNSNVHIDIQKERTSNKAENNQNNTKGKP